MNVEQARFNMIEQQIRPWDVLDASVLQLLSLVRREDFVPASLRALAFMDTELPLGGGRLALAPRVEARLLQELRVQPTDRVLELGTGTGYLTALLAHQAKEVLSLEPSTELAEAARARLRRLGLSRVEVRVAEGLDAGCPSEGPFDAIVATGSLALLPETLKAQVREGGRILLVEGHEPMMRAVLWQRQGDQWSRSERFDIVLPRLAGTTPKPEFAF
ncbi:protein-L-isoaspartate O-methyltransferase family protein [Inhella gelatinilytica]|uniref:Protein-L-isoaspartate O-methyltransferase n=1 Tax=Inhella gelatinilytica TaxID=2795030 RepID=A0A931NEB6_9BURK|nr:protein-L-isoaspartate O-methyltransferase [Inhella gelatinilytica]MBH9553504.1 protein-L-isoaspartate O-methyltransferase [Inhella gelatinilytica]